MPSSKKRDLVSKLTEKLNQAKSVFLADYRGLTSKQLEELRNKSEKVGGSLQIVKNTLLSLSFKDVGLNLPEFVDLSGPTAVVFCLKDEVSGIKTMAALAKIWGKPEVKFGFLGKRFLTKEEVNILSQSATQEELLAQVAGTLQGPLSKLVMNLKNGQTKLVYLLKQLKPEGGA